MTTLCTLFVKSRISIKTAHVSRSFYFFVTGVAFVLSLLALTEAPQQPPNLHVAPISSDPIKPIKKPPQIDQKPPQNHQISVQIHPKTPQKSLKLPLKRALETHNYAVAEALVQHSLMTQPSNHTALLLQARLQRKRGAFQAAAQTYRALYLAKPTLSTLQEWASLPSHSAIVLLKELLNTRQTMSKTQQNLLDKAKVFFMKNKVLE